MSDGFATGPRRAAGLARLALSGLPDVHLGKSVVASRAGRLNLKALNRLRAQRSLPQNSGRQSGCKTPTGERCHPRGWPGPIFFANGALKPGEGKINRPPRSATFRASHICLGMLLPGGRDDSNRLTPPFGHPLRRASQPILTSIGGHFGPESLLDSGPSGQLAATASCSYPRRHCRSRGFSPASNPFPFRLLPESPDWHVRAPRAGRTAGAFTWL